MHSHVYRCCQQWVAPFGYPWITRYQLVPRAFRSVVASFIGSLRLGIHHAPIFVDRSLFPVLRRSPPGLTEPRSHQGPRSPAPSRRQCSSARVLRRGVSSTTSASPSSIVRHRTTLLSIRGAAGTRTPDLRRARAALSQLSYGPIPQDRHSQPPLPKKPTVGAPGLEPGTSVLSGPRSNHLSYAPLSRQGVPAPKTE